MNTQLKTKAVVGISWNLISSFGVLALNFVTSTILARLLSPEDFGIIGILLVIFALTQVFIDSGLGTAYIQKKEVSDVDANTVFFTNLAISCIFYIILYLSAPYIASFYHKSNLELYARVMGLILFINAFDIIQTAQLTRNVDFKRRTIITLISVFTSSIIAISLAFCGLGVWTLIIQQISFRLFITTGLWITSKWSPTLKVSKEAFKNMFSFGSWIFLSSFIQTIFNNIYTLTIGKIFSIVQLGYYNKANEYSVAAFVPLAGSVWTVAFPIFAQLQDDKERLKDVMRNFLQHLMIVTVPLSVTIIVVAKPFVLLIITEKWAPMIPMLQLLSLSAIMSPLHIINQQMLLAIGKSRLYMRLSFILNLISILNLVVMYRFGIIYLVAGIVLFSLPGLYVNSYYTRVYIGYGLARQLNDLKFILIGGALAGVLGYIVSIQSANLLLMLILGSFTTLIIYVVTQYLFNRSLFFEVLSLKSFVLSKYRVT